MLGPEIIDAILGGQADDHLQEIFQAFRTRSRMVADRRGRENVATLTGGDKVRTGGSLSPKYLRGLAATVVRVDGDKVFVTFDEPMLAGRYGHGGPIGVLASCIEAV